MVTKLQSLELTIRNAKGVKGEVQVTRCGAGLEMWVSVNQSGKTLKKWVLRYTDAAGKRQKARIGSYPEMTLVKNTLKNEQETREARFNAEAESCHSAFSSGAWNHSGAEARHEADYTRGSAPARSISKRKYGQGF